jgi:hypothetical protein
MKLKKMGIPPKRDAQTFTIRSLAGVTVINGLGGAGMTLSFGLAEEIVGSLADTVSGLFPLQNPFQIHQQLFAFR